MSSNMWDVLAGKWKQFSGEARIKWGELTDDEWQQIAGNREKLAGMLQERYGYTKEEVEREIDEWADRLNIDI